MAGFEPATPCSQSRCANRAALHLESFQIIEASLACLSGGERGIRTPGTLLAYGSLANCWFKPLTHLSSSIFFWTGKYRQYPLKSYTQSEIFSSLCLSTYMCPKSASCLKVRTKKSAHYPEIMKHPINTHYYFLILQEYSLVTAILT